MSSCIKIMQFKKIIIQKKDESKYMFIVNLHNWIQISSTLQLSSRSQTKTCITMYCRRGFEKDLKIRKVGIYMVLYPMLKAHYNTLWETLPNSLFRRKLQPWADLREGPRGPWPHLFSCIFKMLLYSQEKITDSYFWLFQGI